MADIQFHDLIGSQQVGTLDVQYNLGDPDITLAVSLPSHIVTKGPIVDLRIDGQLFKGTAFSVGNTVVDVTPDPQTADVVHIVGTPVYHVTASSTLEALRDRPIEDSVATSTDTTKVFAPDGSGGVVARAEGGVSAFEDLTTVETDTTLVASPDGAGGVLWRAETGGGGGGSGPLVNIDAHLSSDFPLTTDATWYDVLSVSLPPGTYKAQGMALVQSNHVAPWGAARIWDGTNVYGSGNASLPALNNVLTFTIITKEFVLATTTTLYLSCAAHGGSSVVAAQTFDPDAQPKATILAVQGQGSAATALQEAVPATDITTSGANTWSLVCSLSLTAGEWEVTAYLSTLATANPGTTIVALADGSATTYVTQFQSNDGSFGNNFSISKKITLGSTTTVGLYVMCDGSAVTAYKSTTSVPYGASAPITILHARPA